MENLIVVKSKFIEEEKYQRIKKEINKIDDWFTLKELKKLLKI